MDSNKISVSGEQEASGGTQILEMADKLLANPEIIASVASALGLKHPLEGKKEEAPPPPETQEVATSGGGAQILPPKDKLPELISTIAPLLGGLTSQKSHSDDRRACLLRALKPYLCEE